MITLRFRLLCTVVVATCVTSCGSPTKPAASTTTFQGTIAGTAVQGGSLTITVQTVVASSTPFSFPFVATLHAESVTAGGTLRLAGSSAVTLTGTYDSVSKVVNLSGGGFTFTGTVSGDALSGTWTGPNNATGRFSGLNATSNTVTSYCGTFTSTSPEGGGVWDFETSTSGSVAGFSRVTSNGAFCPFTGQLTGANFALTNCEGTKINGTLAGSTASGSGTASDATSLSFSASTSACQ